MPHSKNEAVDGFWKSYSERSALQVMEEARRTKLPPTPYGTDVLEFNKGDKVIVIRDDAPYIKGFVCVLEDAYLNDGWGRYFAKGVCFHNGDLALYQEDTL